MSELPNHYIEDDYIDDDYIDDDYIEDDYFEDSASYITNPLNSTKIQPTDFRDPENRFDYLKDWVSVFDITFNYSLIAITNILFVFFSQFFINNPLQVAYFIEFSIVGFFFAMELVDPKFPDSSDDSDFWFPSKKIIILHLYLLERNYLVDALNTTNSKNFLDQFLISYIFKQGKGIKFLVLLSTIALFSVLGYLFGNFLEPKDWYIKYCFHFYLLFAMIASGIFLKILRLWEKLMKRLG